jgi:hypothetical protein
MKIIGKNKQEHQIRRERQTPGKKIPHEKK